MISHDPRTEPSSRRHVKDGTTSTRIIDPDQVMGAAYQLFLSRRYVAAEAVCRRLIALDRAYWWCHSLRAAALTAMGRFDTAALDAVDRGLLYEPGNPKLIRLRTEILAAIKAAAVVSRPRKPATGGLRRPGF